MRTFSVGRSCLRRFFPLQMVESNLPMERAHGKPPRNCRQINSSVLLFGTGNCSKSISKSAIPRTLSPVPDFDPSFAPPLPLASSPPSLSFAISTRPSLARSHCRYRHRPSQQLGSSTPARPSLPPFSAAPPRAMHAFSPAPFLFAFPWKGECHQITRDRPQQLSWLSVTSQMSPIM